MSRYAVLDVGTNSIKLSVADRGPTGAWRTVLDRSEITRLGEGLAATGTIQPAAAERSLGAIARLAAEARGLGAAGIVAVGTMALRSAGNRDHFLAEVRGRTGLEIEVLSGTEEARLAALATESALGAHAGSRVLFDAGGGSTQFSLARDGRVLERFSLDLGAVRLSEAHGLGGEVSSGVLAAARGDVATALEPLRLAAPPDAVVGTGGTATSLASVGLALAVYDPDRIHGAIVARREIERQIELYRTTALAARRTIVGLQPARAEVILAGACIVAGILERLGKDAFTVSDRGLRHGVLLARFGVTTR